MLDEIFQESHVCNNHLKNGSVEDIDVLRKFGYITVSDGMNHLVITITPSGADFWKNGGFKNIEKKKSEDNEIKKCSLNLIAYKRKTSGCKMKN